jgi:hypothetical protein
MLLPMHAQWLKAKPVTLKRFPTYVFLSVVLLGVSIVPAAAIDLNKPVENPQLSKALDRLRADTSDAAKDALLVELNKATYLALAVDDGHLRRLTKVDRQEALPPGTRISFLTAGDTGKMNLLLFTDWKAARAYSDAKVIGYVLPAADAWSLFEDVLGSTLNGVVINPAHNTLPLDRRMIAYLRRVGTRPNK